VLVERALAVVGTLAIWNVERVTVSSMVAAGNLSGRCGPLLCWVIHFERKKKKPSYWSLEHTIHVRENKMKILKVRMR